MSDHKRPLEQVENNDDGPVAKKPRVSEQRFRNVIVSIGEEYSATTIYVIQGDTEGREAFETLMHEAKELSEKEEEPLVDILLDTIPPDGILFTDARPGILQLYTRLQELVSKYNLTAECDVFPDASRHWYQGVNTMVVGGFY